MWINYSICIFILLGCGHSPVKQLGIFGSYVEQFEKESIIYNNPQTVIDIIMEFDSSLPEGVAGRCSMSFSSPKITVNVVTWGLISEERKEMLIFHELGHCILGLDHEDDYLAVMNTNLPTSYFNNRVEMLTEFFKR